MHDWKENSLSYDMSDNFFIDVARILDGFPGVIQKVLKRNKSHGEFFSEDTSLSDKLKRKRKLLSLKLGELGGKLTSLTVNIWV